MKGTFWHFTLKFAWPVINETTKNITAKDYNRTTEKP
jgi:hypothetical protein